ncbi:hypothetical protein ACIBJF_47480 [Streptomyces sp. NPDC050743]|uniref:hypothetical protein n=1 Tax=Streptomyces sp. NPDC050743 TaxID=3365634 RepID=UPI0037B0797D
MSNDMVPSSPLGGLLPADVAVAELYDPVDGVELFPQEAEAIAGAVEKRRQEFGSVRLYTRRALARFGLAPRPLALGASGPKWARRAPRWPEGVVGSMTHCAGYHAAAVARVARPSRHSAWTGSPTDPSPRAYAS